MDVFLKKLKSIFKLRPKMKSDKKMKGLIKSMNLAFAEMEEISKREYDLDVELPRYKLKDFI